mmetsp:Transcript_6666/g.11010  ORF Transcript_6666/g.11010 Transcript_6666/m.11010 type:complete len:389 (+) Transcript_6666:2-1168(+)
MSHSDEPTDEWLWCPDATQEAHKILRQRLSSDLAAIILDYSFVLSPTIIRNLQYVLFTRALNPTHRAFGDQHPPMTWLRRKKFWRISNEDDDKCDQCEPSAQFLTAIPSVTGRMDTATIGALVRYLNNSYNGGQLKREWSGLVLDGSTILALKTELNRSALNPNGQYSHDAAVLNAMPPLATTGTQARRISNDFVARLRLWLDHRFTMDAMLTHNEAEGESIREEIEDDRNRTLTASRCNSKTTETSTPRRRQHGGGLQVGDFVAAPYNTMETRNTLFPARVVAVNKKHRTCHVVYDDSDQWKQAPWCRIALRNPRNFPRLSSGKEFEELGLSSIQSSHMKRPDGRANRALPISMATGGIMGGTNSSSLPYRLGTKRAYNSLTTVSLF